METTTFPITWCPVDGYMNVGRYCPQCGSRLTTPPTCTGCGVEQHTSHDKFCRQCGQKWAVPSLPAIVP